MSALLPLFVLLAVLYLPGRALLVLTGGGRGYSPFEERVLAIGVGIAAWPVLFTLHASLPGLPALGDMSVTLLLLLSTAIVAWDLRARGLPHLVFLEWLALAIFAVILGTRAVVALEYPYPAWSDSLHHVLLTQGTAAAGRLPDSLSPWFPEIPVTRYHRGLYALSAPVQWLSGVPAYSALQWTAQGLNGLVGLGTYLVLAKRVSLLAAVVGAVTVGLISQQPAVYVNWGRFTQLAGQVLLPFAWLLVWDGLRALSAEGAKLKSHFGLLVLGAVSSGGVVLLHFRVGIFLALLIGVTVVFEGWRAWRRGSGKRFLAVTGGLVAVAAVVVGPSFWSAVYTHLAAHAIVAMDRGTVFAVEGLRNHGPAPEFYGVAWEALPSLVGRLPLMIAALLAAALGLARRNTFVQLVVAWCVFLLGFAFLYRAGIPFLGLTNEGAVLIALYLPIGFLIGAGVSIFVDLVPARVRGVVRVAVVVSVCTVGIATTPERVRLIDPSRFFVSPEDLAAYAWISENTPEEAIFAVEPYYWMEDFPHPKDGGLWISYFTGRSTVPGPMISSLAPSWHRRSLRLSRWTNRLGHDDRAPRRLAAAGVGWMYIDARRDPNVLDADEIIAAGHGELRYQANGISIIRLQTRLTEEDYRNAPAARRFLSEQGFEVDF